VIGTGFLWCPHCGAPHPFGEVVCPRTGRSIERSLQAERPNEHVLVGSVLQNRYRVDRVLGRGGSGLVFEARDVVFDRPVAIKLVRDQTDPVAIERLKREMQFVARLQHPNVCTIFDVGAVESYGPFIVMERLFGETLATYRMRVPKSTPLITLDIVSQILSVVHAAHAERIVHRDLTPRNVFLVDRLGCAPIVKVMDFGLAKDISGKMARITHKHTQVGTLNYMPPEQLLGEAVTPASDLFAVAILAYELLTGAHPFGTGLSVPAATEARLRLLRGEFAPIKKHDRALPEKAQVVFTRAFAPNPIARYPSAQDLLAALRDALVMTPL
jgi:eukaryotic-like serine/threonine-protein kinase